MSRNNKDVREADTSTSVSFMVPMPAHGALRAAVDWARREGRHNLMRSQWTTLMSATREFSAPGVYIALRSVMQRYERDFGLPPGAERFEDRLYSVVVVLGSDSDGGAPVCSAVSASAAATVMPTQQQIDSTANAETTQQHISKRNGTQPPPPVPGPIPTSNDTTTLDKQNAAASASVYSSANAKTTQQHISKRNGKQPPPVPTSNDTTALDNQNAAASAPVYSNANADTGSKRSRDATLGNVTTVLVASSASAHQSFDNASADTGNKPSRRSSRIERANCHNGHAGACAC